MLVDNLGSPNRRVKLRTHLLLKCYIFGRFEKTFCDVYVPLPLRYYKLIRQWVFNRNLSQIFALYVHYTRMYLRACCYLFSYLTNAAVVNYNQVHTQMNRRKISTWFGFVNDFDIASNNFFLGISILSILSIVTFSFTSICIILGVWNDNSFLYCNYPRFVKTAKNLDK